MLRATHGHTGGASTRQTSPSSRVRCPSTISGIVQRRRSTSGASTRTRESCQIAERPWTVIRVPAAVRDPLCTVVPVEPMRMKGSPR